MSIYLLVKYWLRLFLPLTNPYQYLRDHYQYLTDTQMPNQNLTDTYR